MTTIVAVAAVVAFLAVLGFLARSGRSAVIGGAPPAADKVSLFGTADQLRDTDRSRITADLAALDGQLAAARSFGASADRLAR